MPKFLKDCIRYIKKFFVTEINYYFLSNQPY